MTLPRTMATAISNLDRMKLSVLAGDWRHVTPAEYLPARGAEASRHRFRATVVEEEESSRCCFAGTGGCRTMRGRSEGERDRIAQSHGRKMRMIPKPEPSARPVH